MQRLLALSLVLLVSACCAPKPSTASARAAAPAPVAKPAIEVGAYYAEQAHDGRMYVFGQKKTHDAFQERHSMTYTRTLIGYSAAGTTVVFEADSKSDDLANWLQSEFDRRHGNAAR